MAFMPLLYGTVGSALPALLSQLGIFGEDPAAALRRRVAALSTPQYLANLTNQYWRQAIQSPAFSQAQGAIAAGTNATQNAIAQNIGQSGLSGSGIGAIAGGLGPAMAGHQLAGLKTQAWQGAQGMAQNQVQQLIDALYKGYGPTMTQKMGAAGMDAWGPLFTAWLSAKYPKSFTWPQQK